MNIEEELKNLDEKLRREGVRIPLRPLKCFKVLHGSVLEASKRVELFDPINNWYLKVYGDKAVWNGVIATFPVLVRGEVYSSDVDLTNQNTLIEYKSAIKGLPSPIANQLTTSEFREISEHLQQGNANWRFLYNLLVDDSMLEVRSRQLVTRAIHDLENAALTAQHTQDVQTVLVQSHEAAEKFLKAGLIYAGFSHDPKSLGHNINKVLETLIGLDGRYSALPKPASALRMYVPDMGLRYGPTQWTIEDAVSAYYSSIYICGTLARIWVLDQQRGTRECKFVAARFYETSAGNKGYCISSDESSATLLCFTPVAHQFMRYEIVLAQRESALYLEVTNPQEDARLRDELVWYLRTCDHSVSSQEASLMIKDGKEGSFATGIMKIRRPSTP